ncbi:hypothetical protein [Massilia sp. AB1]|uniref:hypothetical protein n=1 Tax=Massilia sp. AB1 TaxID=2823371 RepID=UPI001B817574|nr:hypothetical protein [Massilia sp. AB1]MBQ5940039.1 hypothetical protein [Massilia sp. AB1]
MRDLQSAESHPPMPDVSCLGAAGSQWLFGEGSHHVPVRLRRIENARVLWLNLGAAEADPQFAACGGDAARYEEHLLSACAYLVDEEAWTSGAETTGHADRYGGLGIGANGGSGRAVVVNGYLVKGCGRTPLVSALTDPAHASGGAYLEESVREVIYGEIVRAEFPHSAIPALAIIDTGLVQEWQESAGPKLERRTLLVRPCFVRPAHFQRATAFHSGYPKEGMFDTLRVAACFARTGAAWGAHTLAALYERLWVNWAQQLAYSFVHRLPHGSNTVSNIALDGKLLDFGATSAVPSWANVATMLASLPFSRHFATLPDALRASAYFFGRYLDPVFATEERIAMLAERAQSAYRQTLAGEALRLCGVPREAAQAAACGPDGALLWSTVAALIGYFQCERIDMVHASPQPALAWDLAAVWDEAPPAHLLALRALLDDLVAPAQRAAAARQCARLCADRTGLYREAAKRAIFRAVDPSHAGEAPDPAHIGRFIREQIAGGRRDHRIELAHAATVGFAAGADGAWIIARCDHGGGLFAVRESAGDTQRLPIRRLTADTIEFADPALPVLEAAVRIAAPFADLPEASA